MYIFFFFFSCFSVVSLVGVVIESALKEILLSLLLKSGSRTDSKSYEWIKLHYLNRSDASEKAKGLLAMGG